MLLTGTEYEVAHDEHGIRVGRQTPDGPMTLLDVPLTGVLTVEGGLYVSESDAEEPDGSLLAITFADPDLRWDGERLGWAPVFITCGVDQIDHVRETIHALDLQLQRVRRRWLALPDVTVPEAVYGPRGPERSDVTGAAMRVQHNTEQLAWLGLLMSEMRPDEFLLEMTPVDGRYLVVTTLRVFVADHTGVRVEELPIDAVCGASLEPAGSNTSRLSLDLGITTVTWHPLATQEAQRLLSGIEFAITARLHQHSYLTPYPDPCAMAQAWETLRDQFQLGAITEDEFQRQASGILSFTW